MSRYSCASVSQACQSFAAIIVLGLLSRNRAVSGLVSRRSSAYPTASAPARSGNVNRRCPAPFSALGEPSIFRKLSAQRGDYFPPLLSSASSSGDSYAEEEEDDSDDEEEEEESDSAHLQYSTKLEALQFKDYDVSYIRDLVERGELQLQPFYQRGYKWSQVQASKYLESILRGYPCVPEIILLSTIDEDGQEKYAVFDGQQRLTSIMLYISNRRSTTWPKRKKDNDDFRLEKLTVSEEFLGKRYQDLPVARQNDMKRFGFRCAIIPASWPMQDYIDFFGRIQGGGTAMTKHELCRALSMDPFTDLLDQLSKKRAGPARIRWLQRVAGRRRPAASAALLSIPRRRREIR